MRIHTISVAFVFAITMTIAIRPASAACSNATLKGVYGYYHGRPAGGSSIYSVLGQFTADGAGNLTGGVWEASLNGSISSGSFTGTYSIAADCTGTLTFSTEDLSPAHFNIALDDMHNGFQMIQSDNGFAQPGFGFLQGKVTCGLTGKKETFATNFLGLLYPGPEIEAISGQVTLDGKGNISGNETLSIGGTVSTVAVVGTYNEGGDCRGAAQITPAGFSLTNFDFVVVNGGKELLLIETDNNTLVAGTAQQ